MMNKNKNFDRKKLIEKTAEIIFFICGVLAIFAVGAITVYVFVKG